MSKIAIVGSRDFQRLDLVRAYVNGLDQQHTIISGGARGVDTVAEDAARARGLAVEVIPADWSTHGRAAGMLNNTTIVERADYVVAFWDGVSRGTNDTIEKARYAGKLLGVCKP